MKTLGIVGGLGPESTIDYYRSIVSIYRSRAGDDSYPHILIDSLDVDQGLRMVSANQMPQLTDYLVTSLARLARAGADFALISANTPHMVFDDVRRLSPLPLISIVEAACDEAMRLSLHRVALMGTRFTMSGRFYPEVFERNGITLTSPAQEEQAYIHDKYLNELVKGIFLPDTRQRLQEIIARQKQRDGIEAVILAGTELPLIFRDTSCAGLPLLDTTQIHVKAALEYMLL